MIEATIENGVLIRYYGTDSEVTVPTGITEIGDEAFSDHGEIEAITLPEGLLKIGDNAFFNCVKLKKIAFPDSLEAVGKAVMSECVSLFCVSIGRGLTEISDWMFQGCAALSGIVLPDNVKRIGELAFSDCVNLVSIRFGAGVEKINEYSFSRCLTLREITVSPDNPYYSSINGMLFSKDGSILVKYPVGRTERTVTVPHTVKTVSARAYEGCSAMTELNVPDNVEMLGKRAFEGCRSLRRVVLPPKLSDIGDGAFSCYKTVKAFVVRGIITFEALSKEIKEHVLRSFMVRFYGRETDETENAVIAAYVKMHFYDISKFFDNSKEFLIFALENGAVPFSEIDGLMECAEEVEIKALLLEYKNNVGRSRANMTNEIERLSVEVFGE